MGQYFLAINETKQEYIDPHKIGSGLKFWEWCANKTAGVFPYLLRRSSSGGGGDIQGIAYGEGSTLEQQQAFAGRWAGDQVSLVGDYDEGGLYQRARDAFTDISDDLANEYNDFIKIDNLKLKPWGKKYDHD